MNTSIYGGFLLAAAALVTASLPTAAEPTADRQKYLRDLVQNECTRCHGYRRIGQNAPPLRPEDLEYRDPDYLIDTILNGRNTHMPAWKGMLSVDDVEFIVHTVLMEPAP
jgi:mono/diheme cytochrome c family protein